jgi:hypothetical protein
MTAVATMAASRLTTLEKFVVRPHIAPRGSEASSVAQRENWLAISAFEQETRRRPNGLIAVLAARNAVSARMG